MGLVIAIYIQLLGVAIAWAVFQQYRRGEAELVSVRNFAILGFLYFQIWALFYPLATGDTLGYRVENLSYTGLIYAGMATLFSVIFWFVYKKGWIVDWLARKTPVARTAPVEPVLWVVAFALAPVAIICKFAVNVPLIGVLAAYAGNPIAAMSAGTAGWIWARRPFNPVAAAMTAALFLVNSFTATIGEFGRRPLIGVGICVLWCMYFSMWRYKPLKKWLPQMAILGFIPLMMMIAYSSIRANRGVTDSVGSLVHGLQRGSNITAGIKMMTILDTGPISLWLIETHPDKFKPRPLFTLYYTFLNPVPRQWWKEKPWPLGMEICDMAGIRNVPDDMNLGPGIIGHAGAEGGWYAVVVYAICGALLFRYADRLSLRALRNPLIMAPLGSGLGQVVAMPRGESSLFAFIFIYGTAVTYATMLVFSWLAAVCGVGARVPADEPDAYAQFDDETYAEESEFTEYGEFDDYGADDDQEQRGEHHAA